MRLSTTLLSFSVCSGDAGTGTTRSLPLPLSVYLFVWLCYQCPNRVTRLPLVVRETIFYDTVDPPVLRTRLLYSKFGSALLTTSGHNQTVPTVFFQGVDSPDLLVLNNRISIPPTFRLLFRRCLNQGRVPTPPLKVWRTEDHQTVVRTRKKPNIYVVGLETELPIHHKRDVYTDTGVKEKKKKKFNPVGSQYNLI